MFLLDTNVLSAMMNVLPAPLHDWLAGTPDRFLYTATLNQAELLAGISVMPPGRRREGLQLAAISIFTDVFHGRIWPFDSSAAEAYADIVAQRRRSGLHIDPVDLMIAAIARIRDVAVVTRNVGDFAECGIEIIDPWDDA
ncbi:MAG TPA: type II toxin-antitoxin system VapC family toxin [Stellaceae bacterium]|jgi:hypothetical protein|nr:type II toxin-antitoxin system VapC family toxin [Stellaceae bacterium]